MPEYVTVEGVEILSAGMNWRGLTGSYFVTSEHLAAMVAAQDDPLVRRPRVKLGHLDALFGAMQGDHDPSPDAIDGEPGFGSVENLRLNDAGVKLIGDLTEVPDWLAAAMPSAYPTRSAEWIWDHTTASKNTYAAVLTDVALGGVWEPAVEDISDITREQAVAALKSLLEEGPEAAEAQLVTASAKGAIVPAPASASVSQDRVIDQFYAQADEGLIEGVKPYYAWCRDIRVDPNELIIDDGQGATLRLPFSTDGEHDVTFGTPVEVRETYVDVASETAAASAAAARTGQRVLATFSRPEGRSRSTTPAASRPEPQEDTMDKTVRAYLEAQGIDPDAATEEQVNAANVFVAAGWTPEGETPTVAEEHVEEAEQVTEPEPVAASQPETVTVSKAVHEDQTKRLEKLESDAAARTAREDKERRDAKASKLVEEGRITAAEYDTWRAQYDRDEEGTDALAATLAPGRVPTPKTQKAGANPSTSASSDALFAATRARLGLDRKEA